MMGAGGRGAVSADFTLDCFGANVPFRAGLLDSTSFASTLLYAPRRLLTRVVFVCNVLMCKRTFSPKLDCKTGAIRAVGLLLQENCRAT